MDIICMQVHDKTNNDTTLLGAQKTQAFVVCAPNCTVQTLSWNGQVQKTYGLTQDASWWVWYVWERSFYWPVECFLQFCLREVSRQGLEIEACSRCYGYQGIIYARFDKPSGQYEWFRFDASAKYSNISNQYALFDKIISILFRLFYDGGTVNP